MSANGRCVAPRDLCSEEYADSVSEIVDNVNFYVDKVYGASDPDERYGYYEQMEIVLSDAWSAYNRGKASCEVEIGDDFMDENFENRSRMLLRDRQLFFKKIGAAFRKVGNFIKKAATAVVKAVVSTVETIVNVVVELVECGVGIATDGLRCGLIGCAFGLVGVALDIAFTIATGGANKAAEAACSLVDAVTSDGEDDDAAKKRKASILAPILKGIGAAVCTINSKLESPILGAVCVLKEQAESIDNGLAIAEIIVNDPISFQFLETFRNAMCGNPGSAVFDLLEEVVSCSIGCAQDDNSFCPATQEEVPASAPSQPAPVPGNGSGENVVEYQKFPGKACRDRNGTKGKEGEDFDLIRNATEEECERRCSTSSGCNGWEYNRPNMRCEIWKTEPVRFEVVSNFDCHVKQN